LRSGCKRFLFGSRSNKVVGGGILNGDCGKYDMNTPWRSAYKPESLTQKVYEVYRRKGSKVCKVATYSNLRVCRYRNFVVCRSTNLFMGIATCYY
jgi:hypothetical protein